jgi:predicted nicotinamide N-methyase
VSGPASTRRFPPVEPLRLSTGEFPLHEYRLRAAEREWSVLHTTAVLTHQDELRFLDEMISRLPYGVALWPAAIALAHEVASRGEALRGASVLELGAGTGLPGIVAASLGARVVQTDGHELALYVCGLNLERNGVAGVEHRLADWTKWDDTTRYDFILGSDILYGESLHPHLRAIFAANLAPGGRILLSDPFRAPSLRLLESLEAEGWRVGVTRWTVGEESAPRAIGLYELEPPR